MLNVIVVSFLLGFSPTQEPSQEITNQWEVLSHKEKNVIIKNFEEEYKMKLSDVTAENIYTLAGLERIRAMRSMDMRSVNRESVG